MYKYISLTFLLMIVSCSSFDFLQKTDGTQTIPKNQSIILDDDFFGNDFFAPPQPQPNNNPLPNSHEEMLDQTIVENTSRPIIKTPLVSNNANEMNIFESESLEKIRPTELLSAKNKKQSSFSVKRNESLKNGLMNFLKPTGYKLIWNTEYDVIFENNVNYKGDDVLDVLKLISNDLSDMGIDIHLNVYLKNKIVLAYSVRN